MSYEMQPRDSVKLSDPARNYSNQPNNSSLPNNYNAATSKISNPNSYSNANQNLNSINHNQGAGDSNVNTFNPNAYNPYNQMAKNGQNREQHYNTQRLQSQPAYCCWYAASVLLFLAAVGINIIVWAIDKYGNAFYQASFFYYNSYPVSTSLGAGASAVSTNIYAQTTTDSKSVALGLLYSWLLWKSGLIVFSYNLIQRNQSKATKIVTLAVLIVVMLAIDVLGTTFLLSFYNDYIWFGIYSLLTVIVAAINRSKEAARDAFIPLALIVLFYSTYAILLPSLYNKYSPALDSSGVMFVVYYLYPFFDMIIFCLLLYFGSFVSDSYVLNTKDRYNSSNQTINAIYETNSVKNFLGVIHFLILGYGVGMVMQARYTEVQFYYLLAYFIFRNVFCSYVMRRWERVICLPPCLPGWGLVYYLSYLLNYLPVVAVGKLVVSVGYWSPLFSQVTPYIYIYPNPLYPYTTANVYTLANMSMNLLFGGSLYWLTGIIIWVAMTFSQKYERRKPNWMELFYYLVGIQLFYWGITCSLQLTNIMSKAAL